MQLSFPISAFRMRPQLSGALLHIPLVEVVQMTHLCQRVHIVIDKHDLRTSKTTVQERVD